MPEIHFDAVLDLQPVHDDVHDDIYDEEEAKPPRKQPAQKKDSAELGYDLSTRRPGEDHGKNFYLKQDFAAAGVHVQLHKIDG